MGIENEIRGAGAAITEKIDVVQEDTEGVVNKEIRLRTKLEQELGVSGAVEAICVYLTKDSAPMVTADDVRSTLDRKGMSIEEVETILRNTVFRRVLAWELDEECARLAENLALAGDEDIETRREALERRKALDEMNSFAIKIGSSVWARPEGREKENSWTINSKSLSIDELSELIRDHIDELSPKFF